MIKKAYGVEMHPGMNIKQFIDADYIADFMENCELTLAGESIRLELLHNYGVFSSWFISSYDPARNNNGEIIGISYNSIDISKRIASQQTALAQQRKLDRIAFIQSHEFRRPVATIKGMLNLMEMDGYDESYPLLKVIRNSVNEIDDNIVEIVNFTVKNAEY